MSAPPWMPFYVSDYINKTRHLTARQHGGYMLLIMAAWQQMGKLPHSNATAMARLAGMTESEWAEDGLIIREFFDENWRHPRVDEELEKAQKKYEKRAEAGKRGGEARAAAMANAKQKPSNASGNAQASEASNALASSSQLTSPSNDGEGAPAVVSRETLKPDKRGSRLPEDYEPDLGVALSESIPLAEAIKEAAKFRDHWRAIPGKDGVKLDWDATWRNWCRRAADFRAKDGKATSQQPIVAETVWITEDDPRWPDACQRYESETGRRPTAGGSRQGKPGLGWYFTAAQVPDDAPKRRTA